jgi:hypothetical protein
MAEEPCGLHAAIKHPLDLPSGETLFAAAHDVHDLQPDVHRRMTGLENGADTDSELLPAGVTFPQTRAAGFALQAARFADHAALWADRAIWPEFAFNISESGFFILELGAGKDGPHGCSPERIPNAGGLGLSSVTPPDFGCLEPAYCGLVAGRPPARGTGAGRREVIPNGLIHHSDRDMQYACGGYIQRLEAARIQPGMSRAGRPWDNAVAESFVATLKREEVDGRTYRDLDDARASIARFLEEIYNQKRLHSALDYLAPTVFETMQRPEPPHVAAQVV